MALTKATYYRIELYEKGADQTPRTMHWHSYPHDAGRNAHNAAVRCKCLVKVYQTVEGNDTPDNRREFGTYDGAKGTLELIERS